MISIADLRRYYENESVYMTNHAAERCRERGIRAKDIRSAVMSGEIIEQYPDDFPFPNCLLCGKSAGEEIIHVCMSDEGESSKVITAYFPSAEKWNADCKTRKEASK